MNLFIVGDIHGCYYTFKTLLQRYWDEKNDVLIQVGDLIENLNTVKEFLKETGE